MLLYNHIKKLSSDFYRLLLLSIYKITGKGKPLCRIEEINILKKTIVIHCRGVEGSVKLSFDEIINDPVMLSNLSSKHASWIGYYYGKHYCNLIREKQKNNASPNFDFSINRFPSQLVITMLNRQNDLVCLDKENNTTCTISPVSAMANERLIKKFDSIQACYIGILAGTSNSKKINRSPLSNSNIPHLRLVK